MTDHAPERVAVAAAVLVAGAAATLFAGATRSAAAGSREFQRVVGGLGAGSATSLYPCAAALDPGVSGVCDRGLEPVPGGFSFCEHHSGPSLRRR